jgi:hypothetical protein
LRPIWSTTIANSHAYSKPKSDGNCYGDIHAYTYSDAYI